MRFIKIPILSQDDSLSHSWHSLNQLHLEWFSNSFEGVHTYAEHLLAAFPSLCGPTHPKPSQLGRRWVIVEARSSDTALHHSPGYNSPYCTQPGGVLGHCPVEKQIIVPLSANLMGWSIAAECCGSHAGQVWILNKSQTVSSAKHHHTTSSMLHMGTTHAENIRSSTYKDTAVATKNLKFGLIRPKDKFSPV